MYSHNDLERIVSCKASTLVKLLAAKYEYRYRVPPAFIFSFPTKTPALELAIHMLNASYILLDFIGTLVLLLGRFRVVDRAMGPVRT